MYLISNPAAFLFQSTCPARGTTISAGIRARPKVNFNPRAPRGARPLVNLLNLSPENIFQSTCPARGTTYYGGCENVDVIISIHVPREGHDGLARGIAELVRLFQSTCPARGTTTRRGRRGHTAAHFNPRAPRGARRPRFSSAVATAEISIHVPREGHDQTELLSYATTEFQSTCPARGTTFCSSSVSCRRSYFNPRAPRGARPCPPALAVLY